VQLENSFTVPVPVDEAWRVLLDIERIAPCMPGAALDTVDGDDFTGRVKVKLGPINLTYQGKASFIEKDEAAHKAVIDARGKDQRGNGTAAAVVTARLKAEGDATRVDVLTDLNITGRPAQFGRGVMTDVGNKLLGQFADKLAAQLGEGDRPAQAPSAPAKAAATAAGAAEEVAASAEQAQADGAAGRAVKKTAAAAKKTAASAADSVSETAAEAAGETKTPAKTAPAKAVAKPAKKAASAGAAATSAPGTGAAESRSSTPETEPAKGASTPAPAGAAPTTPAPVTSLPTAAARPRPVSEPEPIDLLEVAGGAAMARYAAPAAGIGFLLLLLLFVTKRRKRRRARR
jgi:carbon monoxide dehydrogenase subunit G